MHRNVFIFFLYMPYLRKRMKHPHKKHWNLIAISSHKLLLFCTCVLILLVGKNISQAIFMFNLEKNVDEKKIYWINISWVQRRSATALYNNEQIVIVVKETLPCAVEHLWLSLILLNMKTLSGNKMKSKMNNKFQVLPLIKCIRGWCIDIDGDEENNRGNFVAFSFILQIIIRNQKKKKMFWKRKITSDTFTHITVIALMLELYIVC